MLEKGAAEQPDILILHCVGWNFSSSGRTLANEWFLPFLVHSALQLHMLKLQKPKKQNKVWIKKQYYYLISWIQTSTATRRMKTDEKGNITPKQITCNTYLEILHNVLNGTSTVMRRWGKLANHPHLKRNNSNNFFIVQNFILVSAWVLGLFHR